MGDSHAGAGSGPYNEVSHSAEEKAAFNERVAELAGYAQLLEDAERDVAAEEWAEKDDATANISDPTVRMWERDRVEERHLARRSWLWVMLGLILAVILIVVGVFYFGSGEDKTAPLAGSSEAPGSARGDDGAQSLAAAPAGASADGGVVSGTWVVYSDESKGLPAFELTFQPNGTAKCLYTAPDAQYSVDSWSYTQDGDAVEVEVALRVIVPEFGVNETSTNWLHLTMKDGTMTGSWEQDMFGYETVGDTAGTVHRSGVHEVPGPTYAEPKSTVQ